MDGPRASAEQNRARFRLWFEHLPDAIQYQRILDALPIYDLLKACSDKRTLTEKLPALREYYYTRA